MPGKFTPEEQLEFHLCLHDIRLKDCPACLWWSYKEQDRTNRAQREAMKAAHKALNESNDIDTARRTLSNALGY